MAESDSKPQRKGRGPSSRFAAVAGDGDNAGWFLVIDRETGLEVDRAKGKRSAEKSATARNGVARMMDPNRR